MTNFFYICLALVCGSCVIGNFVHTFALFINIISSNVK